MRKHRAGHLRLAASALTALMLMSTVGPLLPTARVLAAEADAGTGTWPQADEALQTGDIAIDETNFPDEKFREIVKSKCDTNNNGSLSPDEIAACTSIVVPQGNGVGSLRGIEFFTELKSLNCGGLTLTEFDVSKNEKLEELTITSCRLTSLDVSRNPNLRMLHCGINRLTSLDLSKNADLEELNCMWNQLTGLDVSHNPKLMKLDCRRNQITGLDVRQNQKLTVLYCDNNQLQVLDVSQNQNLTSLDCGYNQLSAVDVSRNQNLISLGCGGNLLSSLDVSGNAELTGLSCEQNQLKELNISKNTKLRTLSCGDNQLTSLALKGHSELMALSCGGNQLTNLDVDGTDVGPYDDGGRRFSCDDNSRTLVHSTSKPFDLSTLPGFDVSRVDMESVQGGSIDGTILTVNPGETSVSYGYFVSSWNRGEEMCPTFTLVFKEPEPEPVPDTAVVEKPNVSFGTVSDEKAKAAAETVALEGFDTWLQGELDAMAESEREKAVSGAATELGVAPGAVRVYMQGYLDIALKDYQDSEAGKSISMDITPRVRMVASTADRAQDVVLNDGPGKNAVLCGEDRKADVKEAEISLTLPQGFILEDNTPVYVKHEAADGTYYYRSKANRDGLLTFVTKHGFSPFTVSLNADVDALVGETGYDTLQEAVDAVGSGGTVVALQNNLTAKVSGEKTFTLDTDGHAGVTLTAAEGYVLKDNGNGSYTVSEAGITAKLTYQSHIQSLGWEKVWTENGGVSGTMHQSKRMEAIRMKIEDPAASGGIEYRTHIQSLGWEKDWKKNGEDSGTTNQRKRLEAVQIRLTDELTEKYDVYYRAYVQSYGWLGWAKNGGSAGTEGLSKRLEAIEVRLVKKGSAAPGSGLNAFVKGGETAGINYRSHVQTYDWTDWVSNGQRAGTEGESKRLEALEIRLANLGVSGGVRYRSHVQSLGWEKDWKQDGAVSGTTKRSKRLEAVQIELTGEAAEKYDIYYRAHIQSYGWLDWAENGGSAGSEGLSKRMEAIEIRLVEKGGEAPGKTDRSFVKK